MAKVIITIHDKDNGEIEFEVEFEPELEPAKKGTQSQYLALKLLEFVKELK